MAILVKTRHIHYGLLLVRKMTQIAVFVIERQRDITTYYLHQVQHSEPSKLLVMEPVADTILLQLISTGGQQIRQNYIDFVPTVVLVMCNFIAFL